MNTITFRPIGRLGNNIFQTAACIGYAKKYGFQWKVPLNRAHNDNDPYLLERFWPNLPFTQNWQFGEFYHQHDPKDFDYKPIPRFKHDVTLVGFFQSEKWFDNAKEEVRAAFPLKYYPEYDGYVSIHVRRGDYVANKSSFPPIQMNYIEAALNKIKTQKILVFSDGIDWCKVAFEHLNTSQMHIEFNDDEDEFIALSKMASCSHHIIANSTFSFWGAWLGFNPNKIVISPHYTQWFGPTGPPPPIDLIPDSWVQVKV